MVPVMWIVRSRVLIKTYFSSQKLHRCSIKFSKLKQISVIKSRTVNYEKPFSPTCNMGMPGIIRKSLNGWLPIIVSNSGSTKYGKLFKYCAKYIVILYMYLCVMYTLYLNSQHDIPGMAYNILCNTFRWSYMFYVNYLHHPNHYPSPYIWNF